MHTWLTVAELSRRLGRPPSTLRLWRDTYDVPEQINEDGHQTFPLEVYEAIVAMRDQRLTPREIRAALAESHGWQPTERPAAATLGEVVAELRAIRAAVERIAALLAERNE